MKYNDNDNGPYDEDVNLDLAPSKFTERHTSALASAGDNNAEAASKNQNTMRSTVSAKIVIFAMEYGRTAGKPLSEYMHEDLYIRKFRIFDRRAEDPTANYHPFVSECNFAMAA